MQTDSVQLRAETHLPLAPSLSASGLRHGPQIWTFEFVPPVLEARVDSRNERETWLMCQQPRIRYFLFRVFLRDVNLKTLDDELFDMCPIFGQVLVAAISGAGEGSKEPELFITQ